MNYNFEPAFQWLESIPAKRPYRSLPQKLDEYRAALLNHKNAPLVAPGEQMYEMEFILPDGAFYEVKWSIDLALFAISQNIKGCQLGLTRVSEVHPFVSRNAIAEEWINHPQLDFEMPIIVLGLSVTNDCRVVDGNHRVETLFRKDPSANIFTAFLTDWVHTEAMCSVFYQVCYKVHHNIICLYNFIESEEFASERDLERRLWNF